MHSDAACCLSQTRICRAGVNTRDCVTVTLCSYREQADIFIYGRDAHGCTKNLPQTEISQTIRLSSQFIVELQRLDH